MSLAIERVAVIGAGTMGAAIAAHAANAGLSVLLLDIVPRELDAGESARGLSLDSPAVRNRIVKEGFKRIRKLKPPSFMSAAAEARVELGNLEDDFERLREADWIVEAVVEKLEVKRQLFARLESVLAPGALLTSNTSGLPIDAIVEGLGEELRKAVFGTHFFNPPRYMKLLEVIAGSSSDPERIRDFADFARTRLGKGVVFARDTPNFIGNRLLSVHGAHIMEHALAQGYRCEEVDAVTGPLIGRPKTAMFRLQDLVGIDVSTFVARNLYGLIPDDPYREVLMAPGPAKVLDALMERGSLGNKSGHGFYRRTKARDERGRPVFEVLDLESLEYGPAQSVRFAAVGAVRKIPDLGQRLRALFAPEHREDRGAQLAWYAVARLLEYAAAVAPEVAWDLAAVDRAVRWGFSYEVGPFELWDLLGVEETAQRLRDEGFAVASWVEEMLAAGHSSFYRREEGQAEACYRWQSKAYEDLEQDPRQLSCAGLRAAAGNEGLLSGNAGHSLVDSGQGVLLLHMHSKVNAIDDQLVAMLNQAAEELESGRWQGLVIGTDGERFSVGADLVGVAKAAASGDMAVVERAVSELQDALARLRAAPAPVVAAVAGMALGGGCELALGVDRIVAAAESYFGLVEAGVGLIPAGGGLKELVRRRLSPGMAQEEADPLPIAKDLLELVGMGKVSNSAAEAAQWGFLAADDRIVMNRDHLLAEARDEVLAMAGSYQPPSPEPLYAGGRDLYAALNIGVWSLGQAGWASEHDQQVARRVALVLAGGEASAPGRMPEQHFLDLEQQGFLQLLASEKTQERIRHMLETGKPLRN